MKLSPDNPFRRPGYRFFLLFQVITSMGGGFHFVASHWILYKDQESPASTAMLVLSYMVPMLIVMPICGVFTDRYNRRKLLMLATVYQLLLDIGLIALMVSGVFQATHLYVYAPLMSIGNALFWTTLPAFLREQLRKEELLHANSLNTSMLQGGYLVGAGMAGVLYPILGPIGSFAVDGISFGIGFLGWAYIGRWFKDKHRARFPHEKHSFLKEFLEGITYARTNASLFILALFCLVPRFAATFVNVLLAGFCSDSLNEGPESFGVLDMAYGVGAMFCGMALPGFLAKFGSRAFYPTVAIFLTGVAIFFLAGSPNVPMSVVFLGLFGFFAHVAGIITSTTLQKECEESIIGRITSLVSLVNILLAPTLVWALGQYADKAHGTLVFSDPIRDGFIAVAIFYAIVSFLSLLGVYPYLKKQILPQVASGT